VKKWLEVSNPVVFLFLSELCHGLPIEPGLFGHFGIALDFGEAAMA